MCVLRRGKSTGRQDGRQTELVHKLCCLVPNVAVPEYSPGSRLPIYANVTDLEFSHAQFQAHSRMPKRKSAG